MRRAIVGLIVLTATLLAASWQGEARETAASATRRSPAEPTTTRAGRTVKWSGPFFFIQMVDTQLGMRTAEEGGLAKDIEHFEKAIAHANRLKPAFVIICGDLVNGSRDKTQIAQFKRIAAKLDKAIPLRLAPGNHDIPRTKENVLQLGYYRKLYGKDRYAFTHGGCAFVVFNSYLPMLAEANKKTEAEQFTWLGKTLAASRAAGAVHTVALHHHPIFLKSVDEKDGYFNFPPAQRKRYLDLLVAGGVRYTFTGHAHRNNIARYKSLEMVTTSAVSKPLGPVKAPPGFRIVKVYRDRITHKFHGLDAMPKTVDLSAPAATQAVARKQP